MTVPVYISLRVDTIAYYMDVCKFSNRVQMSIAAGKVQRIYLTNKCRLACISKTGTHYYNITNSVIRQY